ncbi:hypothetical protein C2G38_2137633 [Gigaspora rosea]|uniref:Uncharacterized protein n=1 Tax=Gigaspora rosea TaxID=44941 RepID=A0A397VZ50_9GLOM|nr:hypothetical protein C2G38_2137633 [Gigaspora rosea]
MSYKNLKQSIQRLLRQVYTTLKTFKPYWNEFMKEISQKLPLYITVATNLNTLNSPSIRLAQNSWFSVKALECKAQQDDSQAASHSVTAPLQEIIECIQKKIKDESEPKKKRPKTSTSRKSKKNKTLPISEAERNINKMVW